MVMRATAIAEFTKMKWSLPPWIEWSPCRNSDSWIFCRRHQTFPYESTPINTFYMDERWTLGTHLTQGHHWDIDCDTTKQQCTLMALNWKFRVHAFHLDSGQTKATCGETVLIASSIGVYLPILSASTCCASTFLHSNFRNTQTMALQNPALLSGPTTLNSWHVRSRPSKFFRIYPSLLFSGNGLSPSIPQFFPLFILFVAHQDLQS